MTLGPQITEIVKEQQAEIERLKRTQMSAETITLAQTAAFTAQRADALERKGAQLTKALLTAMALIDQLVTENSRLCAASNEPPPLTLFAAKASFDTEMKTLLGD